MNIYLTTEERNAISRAADELGTTKAYVVRLVVRQAVGLPIGTQGKSEIKKLAEKVANVDMSTF